MRREAADTVTGRRPLSGKHPRDGTKRPYWVCLRAAYKRGTEIIALIRSTVLRECVGITHISSCVSSCRRG